MAMPDKTQLRPMLVELVMRAELLRTVPAEPLELILMGLSPLVLALADAEWEREERAAELEAEQADRQLKADKENA